jgi:REP element-mobilizing transposase RayT
MWHHVMHRGADRQDIFSDDVDFCRFEGLAGDVVDRDLLEVHAYTLMTNHSHLLVRSPTAALSEAMHRLGSEYARWYNDRHQRDGPLFRGRFRSVPVTSDEQLVTVARYIHRNALSLVPRGALSTYRWSSFAVYCGRREPPPWLSLDAVGSITGMDGEAYRSFVETDLPSDAVRGCSESPRLCALDVIRGVADVGGVAVDAVVRPDGRDGRLRRQLAITMCVEFRVAATEDLAATFSLSGPSAVRVIARRGRVRLADDPGFEGMHARVVQRILGSK